LAVIRRQKDRAVPRFHLNVFNCIDAYDEEGIERPSIEVAKLEAVAGARDLIASFIRLGNPVYRRHRIEITDEAGILLDTVFFEDVIDLRP
jgi:hypothetical protein